MGRINNKSQQNLWGRSGSPEGSLDPQRSDLWFVDFKNVVDQLRERLKSTVGGSTGNAQTVDTLGFSRVPGLWPQLVKSIAFPEAKVRAEMIRRGSLPYQLPSWDEPLDMIKVQFIADLTPTDAVTGFTVAKFMRSWLEVARVGRGRRVDGAPIKNVRGEALLLEEGVDGSLPFPLFRSDFAVYMLRGLPQSFSQSSAPDNRVTLARLGAAAAAAARSLGNAFVRPDALLSSSSASGIIDYGGMVVSTEIRVKNAWLSSFRMSDLTYESPGLVSFEATIYADSLSYDGSEAWF